MAGKSSGPGAADEDPLGQGWGRGEYNAELDLWEYYDPRVDNGRASGKGYTWQQIWDEWDPHIEADLQSEYGIDCTPELLASRSARWLRVRITGLLHTNSRLARVLARKHNQPVVLGDDDEPVEGDATS